MVELVWDGKYDSNGKRTAPLRLKLPFQTVETVNESIQQRQMALDLFSAGRNSEWRNRLIWGDKKYVLPALLDEFAGKVDLIYIDPPFNVGADFSFTANIPDNPETDDDETTNFIRQPSIIEQKAYRDTWGKGLDSYLLWFYETAYFLRELLSETGSIYVHLDYHAAHYAKIVLDEIFGNENFRNEIIWKRKGGSANPINRLGVVTDSIMLYSKTDSIVFNQLYTKETDEAKKYIEERFNRVDEKTRRKFMDSPLVSPNPRPNLTYTYKGYSPPPNGWSISEEIMEQWDKEGKLLFPADKSKRIRRKIFLDEYIGQPIQNLWNDIYVINSQSNEFVGYDTQKPESLLERIIKTSSKENDLVLDCFCGSGTTAATAEKMGRRWITCDLGRFAIHTARKRLLGIQGVKPFEVQNLGKYERQAWQAAEFGGEQEAAAVVAHYRRFILDLYKARPIQGYNWLHGLRDGRMVHIGAVDSPISPDDVKQIAIEFHKATGTGKDAPSLTAVDVLGWDFAFALNEVAKQQASEAGINMRFIRIPHEVLEKKAVEQGDIKFFELAALGTFITQKAKEITLQITDFIIPPDDVPDEVQKAITHFSQWIDYWAVDWDNKDDTFHNMWQAYRTRQDGGLTLKASHIYDEAGEYTVMVKAIDILGNDTTKILKVIIS